MCGIAGLVNVGDREALVRMTDRQQHRGPDDAGIWMHSLPTGGCVGLGNRRLAILDLSSAGHMPMASQDGNLWITYNGEIYNFPELREELSARGHQFRSRSDTEVILRLYEEMGEACLNRLNGMFALAIWDQRRCRLLLARDPLGIKPLYYARVGKGLIFASEVRALLASGLVARQLSRRGLMEYLSFGSVYDPNTMVEGISALRSGHWLSLQDDAVEIREYWDVAPAPAGSQAPDVSGNGRRVLLERIGDLLRRAAVRHTISDVPIGIFLSGGVDSSALVALLADTLGSGLNTFAVGFREEEFSELPYSRLMAERFRTDHHELILSVEECMRAVPEVMRAMDQPTMEGVNTYIVSRETRRAGLKVALSGLGGDEVFGGYSAFRDVPRAEALQAAWTRVPASVRAATAGSVRLAGPRTDRFRKLATLMAADSVLAHPYFVGRMLFTPDTLGDLWQSAEPELWRESAQPIADSLARAQSFDAVNRVSYLELRNYLQNTLLRDADSMSMAHSLELRVPFLDRELVEYMATIPGDRKIDAHTPKHLLVKSLGDSLPGEIVYRRKRGFMFPWQRWLQDGLREEVERVLGSAGDTALGTVLRPETVGRVWKDFLEGKTSWSRPWALYVLTAWCGLYLE